MSRRKISDKAKKQYFRLMRETKDMASFNGHWDWGWAPMYMNPENKNLLKDIKHYLLHQQQRELNKDNNANINPDDAKARIIVLKFIEARLATYKLSIEEQLGISTL